MRKLAVLLAVLTPLGLPTMASAAQGLSIGRARHAILHSERLAWRGEHVSIAVGPCKHYGPTVVLCDVFFTGRFYEAHGPQREPVATPATTIKEIDRATLAHSRVRVTPYS
jgi:hypothetical protein